MPIKKFWSHIIYNEYPSGKTLELFIAGVFMTITLGTGIELLLLEHTEDVWQLTPIILLPLALLIILWNKLSHSLISVKVFHFIMILIIISGFLGVWFHYSGNSEFELEIYPDRKGFELFWESMKGATPALAPGTMIAVGLLGLIFPLKRPNKEP